VRPPYGIVCIARFKETSTMFLYLSNRARPLDWHAGVQVHQDRGYRLLGAWTLNRSCASCDAAVAPRSFTLRFGLCRRGARCRFAHTAAARLAMWAWTGGYVGTHVGAAWGNTKFSDPAGTSLFGDNVATPGFIGGFQAGYNWQVPQTRFVLGIEGDLSGLASKGSNTCLASSRLVVSADCRVEPNASATVTPRIGYAIDPQGRTLAYIKGGFAAIHDRTEISINGTTPKTETTDRFWAGRRARASSVL
jgi:opacity protein-like surface antigen